jgi:hypothetical protein
MGGAAGVASAALAEIDLDYELDQRERELHHVIAESMVPGWAFWGPACAAAVLLLAAGVGSVLFIFPLSPWFTPLAIVIVVVIAAAMVSTVGRYRGHPYRRNTVQIFTPHVTAKASPEGVRHGSRFVRSSLRWSEVKLLIVSEHGLIAATNWLTLMVPRREVEPLAFTQMVQWAIGSAPNAAIQRGEQLAPTLGLRPAIPG